MNLERDYPLARLTTVRAGGPADLFARPEDEGELTELLRWAASQEITLGVVGSGSNLLVSDDGYRGLVLKLDGKLAATERQGTCLICGGGARLPSAAAQAARWGLSGLEFGINIPGTVGGAVKMNANAYGGELGRVLECVNVCTAEGVERRQPSELGFAYRRSNLGPDEVVSQASFQLAEGEVAEIKGTLAEMRGMRREAQPSGIKTFGSTFKNPSDDERAGGRTAGQLLEATGCRGLQVGGARFAEKHANFVENAGGATTADILSLMAEGRRRVHERFGVTLEPEVQVLGEVEWPEAWSLDTSQSSRIRQELPRWSANHPPVRGTAATAAGKRRASAQTSRARPATRPAKGRTPSRPSRTRPKRRATPRSKRRMQRARTLLRSISVRRRTLLLALLAGALTLTYFGWFRDSSLVAVGDVQVEGVSSADSKQIVAELTHAAKGMTTLHVQTDDLSGRGPGVPLDRLAERGCELSARAHDRGGRAPAQADRPGRRPPGADRRRRLPASRGSGGGQRCRSCPWTSSPTRAA